MSTNIRTFTISGISGRYNDDQSGLTGQYAGPAEEITNSRYIQARKP